MDKYPYIVNENNCWICSLGKTSAGYAVAWENSKPFYVHIKLWEQKNGPVPNGLELDHTCRTTSCINPDHLEAVSHAENIRRAKSNLTWDVAESVRSKAANGVRVCELAKEYSIDSSNVCKIIKRKRWASK